MRSRSANQTTSTLSTAARLPLESLEARRLMSSFVYSDLAELINPPGASALADGYNGPIAVVGDVDGDSTPDILVANSFPFIDSITGVKTVFEHAALISGRTTAVLRAYTFYEGQTLAALGDVDADGVPDYAIGGLVTHGANASLTVYSGRTGDALRTFGVTTADPYARVTVSRAGDFDHDGHADILLGSWTDQRAVLYSGADGSALRTISGVAPAALLGGVDFNGDGTSDLVVSTIVTLTVYSGQDGSSLFSIAHPPRPSLPAIHIESGADFNGDGTPDLLVTTREDLGPGLNSVINARLYSGADGSLLHTLTGPDGLGFSSDAVIVDDINHDGTADIAATIAGTGLSDLTGMSGVHAGNAAYLYSGVDFSVLAVITDNSAAIHARIVVQGGESDSALALGRSLAMADLNGDGVGELIAGASYFYALHPEGSIVLAASRVLAFDGATLGNPVFDGTTTDLDGNFIAWGHLGQREFLFRDHRVTYLSAIEGVGTDRIWLYRNDRANTVLVVGPRDDPSRARIWVGANDLSFIAAAPLDGPVAGTPPAGDYALARAVSITQNAVYLDKTRDGTTPTVWRLAYTIGGTTLTTSLEYLFDGKLVGAGGSSTIGDPKDIVAAVANDDPKAGIVQIIGQDPVRFDNFAPTAVSPVGQLAGVGQRAGDPGPRPYTYDARYSFSTFLGLGVPGGSDWMPLAYNDYGDVAGTYRNTAGDPAIFLRATGVDSVDVLTSEILGAPGPLDASLVTALRMDHTSNGLSVILDVRPPDASATTVALGAVDSGGPYLSPTDAAFAIADDGSIVVTRNAAGELFVLFAKGQTWSRIEVNGKIPFGSPKSPAFFGGLVTWLEGTSYLPSIALATDDGLLLLEGSTTTEFASQHGTVSVPAYRLINLTTDVPGAQAITHSPVTMRSHDGLQIVAGLTASGDLVMYQMTSRPSRLGDFGILPSHWSFTNLYDTVLRPTGVHEPQFQTDQTGNLIAYVTAWDGWNIAGIDSSTNEVIVFWTAPGLGEWRASSLDQALEPGQSARVSDRANLNVYLTPWGGVNIVGGGNLGVYWWAPGLDHWHFDTLVLQVGGSAPALRSQTVTTYVTPWGGLNIAGLDAAGQLWIYWWAPGQSQWTADALAPKLPTQDQQFRPVGKLAAASSGEGRTSIFARTEHGDIFRYAWSPTEAWHIEIA